MAQNYLLFLQEQTKDIIITPSELWESTRHISIVNRTCWPKGVFVFQHEAKQVGVQATALRRGLVIVVVLFVRMRVQEGVPCVCC